MRFLSLACTVAAGLILGTSAAAQGTTWYVDVNGVAPGSGTALDPYTSIDFAVHQPTTVSGDTVLVLPGVYEETVEIVNKGITVLGLEGATKTTINAMGKGTVVTVIGTGVEHNPLIDGFTIMNGTGTLRQGFKIGGGILAEETDLKVLHCIITENLAVLGGGVASTDSALYMYDCEVRNNVASNSMWCGPADGHGGGLYIRDGCGLDMNQCGIRWNLAGRGGGLYGNRAAVQLSDVPIRENTVHGLDFREQVAFGGGVFMQAGAFWMDESIVEDNRATGFTGMLPMGGGFYFAEPVKVGLRDVEFSRNLTSDPVTRSSGKGGAIATETNRFIGQDLKFYENWAGTAGGGIWGPATVTDAEFIGNWAHGQGGGTWGATVSFSEFVGNEVIPLDPWAGNPQVSTHGAGAYGGSLEYCLFRDNIAHGYAGQIDPASFGGAAFGAEVFRCVVYDNQADFGGGLAECDVEHVTVCNNTAMAKGGGGGLFYMRNPGTASSAIVWDNYNCQITDLSSGALVIYSDVKNGYPGLGNRNELPMFWDPVAYDFHLKPVSPCISEGDPSHLPDPNGSKCDMGAMTFDANYCGTPSTFCRGKVNSQACTPAITFEGSPSLTGTDDFRITARRVLNGVNGVLVWSYLSEDLPFHGGTLCVRAPLNRMPVQNSGGTGLPGTNCGGSFSQLFSQADMASSFMWVGRTFYAQYHYRDEGFTGPLNVGFTDGLRVTVCP